MKTFDEFQEKIDEEKNRMHNFAWFVLSKVLDGEKMGKTRVDVAKYVIDRFEGKPTQRQELSGEMQIPTLVISKKEE